MAADPKLGQASRAWLMSSAVTPLLFVSVGWRRLRHGWSLAVAMCLGQALASALALSVTLVQTTAAEIGLQRTVAGLGDDGNVRITANDVPNAFGFTDFVTMTRSELRTVMGGLLKPGAAYLDTTSLVPVSHQGQPLQVPEGSPRPVVSYYDGIDQQVAIVEGHPAGAGNQGGFWQVTVSTEASKQLNLDPGDVYCLSDFGGNQVCVQVAGVWQARNSSSSYWGSDHVPNTSLMAATPGEYFSIAHAVPEARSFGHASFSPDPSAFRAYQLSAILHQLGLVRGHYTVGRGDMEVATSLDLSLQTYQDRFERAQFAIQLLSAQILLIALVYLSFAAGRVLEQQRGEFSLWRSRGWSRLRSWSLLTMEFLGLAIVSLPIGIGFGLIATVAAIRLAYGAAPLTLALQDLPVLWPPAVLAAALGLVVLGVRAAVVSREGIMEARRLVSRPVLHAWWQWRYIDMGLLLLGVILLLRGPALGESQALQTPDQGVDPSTLALPGVGLIFIALAALRLLPPFAWAMGRVANHVSAALAAWQLSRRPLQHSALALLLLVTISLGVFASAYLTTERENALDRAAYAAGSDIRAEFSHDLTKPPSERVARDVEARFTGVTSSSLVYRGAGQPGDAPLEPTVLGVDPYSFGQVAWSRPGLNSTSMDGLLRSLVPRPGGGTIELPDHPVRVGVWVYSPGLAAQVRATLEGGDSRQAEISLGLLDYAGWRYLDAALPWNGRGVRYPIYLRNLTITEPPSPSSSGQSSPGDRPRYPAQGTIGITDLSSTQAGETRPQLLSRLDSSWFATRSEGGLSLGTLQPTMDLQRDGQPVALLTPDVFDGDMVIRPVPAYTVLPVLAQKATLDRLGIRENAPFELTIGSAKVNVEVVGTVDYFPTLYPVSDVGARADYLVVDRDPLLDQLSFSKEPHSWPNEIWLRTTGHDDPRIVGFLHNLPSTVSITSVVSRRQLQRGVELDPLGLELEANLFVGFGVALLLAVAAFGLHFVVTRRGRRSEYAILDANGLWPGTVQRSLLMEQSLLILFSLLVGGLLGAIAAWAILPALHLDTSLQGTIPPTEVLVDPRLTGAALLAVVLLALITGRLGTRLGGRTELAQELRTLS